MTGFPTSKYSWKYTETDYLRKKQQLPDPKIAF